MSERVLFRADAIALEIHRVTVVREAGAFVVLRCPRSRLYPNGVKTVRRDGGKLRLFDTWFDARMWLIQEMHADIMELMRKLDYAQYRYARVDAFPLQEPV